MVALAHQHHSHHSLPNPADQSGTTTQTTTAASGSTPAITNPSRASSRRKSKRSLGVPLMSKHSQYIPTNRASCILLSHERMAPSPRRGPISNKLHRHVIKHNLSRRVYTVGLRVIIWIQSETESMPWNELFLNNRNWVESVKSRNITREVIMLMVGESKRIKQVLGIRSKAKHGVIVAEGGYDSQDTILPPRQDPLAPVSCSKLMISITLMKGKRFSN